MPLIDLRSDTVTKPSPAMRQAMAQAEVGDDIFGEDPSVNRLQETVAQLLGKEAALYMPSGSMANQVCIKVHTRAGDEIIVEKDCHVFNYETAGIAFLSSVQVNTIVGHHGVMPLAEIKKAIRPKLYYMPRTALICLENTNNRAGGTIYPIEEIKAVSNLARNEGINIHLDGARLWNACIATGISPKEYASHFDSVSVCLSKGLGAPVGSVIAGPKAFVEEARHFRKLFGGGMRQAGILAAAGLYALEHNMQRLVEDHTKASRLAETLSTVRGFSIDRSSVQTNIVIIDVAKAKTPPTDILSTLKKESVLLSAGNYMGIRAVTHLDVSLEEIQKAGEIITKAMERLERNG